MKIGEARTECRGNKAFASVSLEGSGKVDISSGSGIVDHMLHAFAKTGMLDLKIKASVGYGIAEALGEAIGLSLDSALKDRSGIRRYGSAIVPMDEALAEVALDFSGRPYLVFSGQFCGDRIGDFEVQQFKPFFEALTIGAHLTLHIRFYGDNDHHKAESIFKAFGLAVRQAVAKEGEGIPSTKGMIFERKI